MASDKKKNTVLLDNVYSELSLFFACNVMRFLLFAKTRDFLVYNSRAISRASNPRSIFWVRVAKPALSVHRECRAAKP